MQPGNATNDPRFNMRNKSGMNYLMQLQERKSHKTKLNRINDSKAISKNIMQQQMFDRQSNIIAQNNNDRLKYRQQQNDNFVHQQYAQMKGRGGDGRDALELVDQGNGSHSVGAEERDSNWAPHRQFAGQPLAVSKPVLVRPNTRSQNLNNNRQGNRFAVKQAYRVVSAPQEDDYGTAGGDMNYANAVQGEEYSFPKTMDTQFPASTMSSDFQRGDGAGATRVMDATGEGQQENGRNYPTLAKASEEQLTNEFENRDEEGEGELEDEMQHMPINNENLEEQKDDGIVSGGEGEIGGQEIQEEGATDLTQSGIALVGGGNIANAGDENQFDQQSATDEEVEQTNQLAQARENQGSEVDNSLQKPSVEEEQKDEEAQEDIQANNENAEPTDTINFYNSPPNEQEDQYIEVAQQNPYQYNPDIMNDNAVPMQTRYLAVSGAQSAKSGSKYLRKYKPAKHEKWRNMDIEVANEALLKKMVSIVNRKNLYTRHESHKVISRAPQQTIMTPLLQQQRQQQNINIENQEDDQQPGGAIEQVNIAKLSSPNQQPLQTAMVSGMLGYATRKSSMTAHNSKITVTNQPVNQRKLSEINKENRRLLSRLMYTPSSYPKAGWEKHASNYFWSKDRLQSNNKKQLMMKNMRKGFYSKNQIYEGYQDARMSNMARAYGQDAVKILRKGSTPVTQIYGTDGLSAQFNVTMQGPVNLGSDEQENDQNKQPNEQEEALSPAALQKKYNDEKFFTHYSNPNSYYGDTWSVANQQAEGSPVRVILNEKSELQLHPGTRNHNPRVGSVFTTASNLQYSGSNYNTIGNTRDQYQTANGLYYQTMLSNSSSQRQARMLQLEGERPSLFETTSPGGGPRERQLSAVPMTDFQAKQLQMLVPQSKIVSMGNIFEAMKIKTIIMTNQKMKGSSKSQKSEMQSASRSHAERLKKDPTMRSTGLSDKPTFINTLSQKSSQKTLSTKQGSRSIYTIHNTKAHVGNFQLRRHAKLNSATGTKAKKNPQGTLSNPMLAYSNPAETAGGPAAAANTWISPGGTEHYKANGIGPRGVSAGANIKMTAEGQQQRPKTAGNAQHTVNIIDE